MIFDSFRSAMLKQASDFTGCATGGTASDSDSEHLGPEAIFGSIAEKLAETKLSEIVKYTKKSKKKGKTPKGGCK